MNRKIKILLVIFTLFIGIFFVNSVNVKAGTEGVSKEETLTLMNTPITITKGMYDNYTDSEKEISNSNFLGSSIYNYCDEEIGICGYNMEYTLKPDLYSNPVKNGKAIIHGDDPIIYFVPRELFIHRGTYTYVGKEYGFFVNTERTYLDTANFVDIFIFDIIANYDNEKEHFSYTIKPLYVFSYVYLSEYFFLEQGTSSIYLVDMILNSKQKDAVIPIPKMKDKKIDNQYGRSYPQNYIQTQPHKDLYAVKDTTAFLNITNANSKNSFDNNYDIEEDNGYRIGRSYVTFNGYSAINSKVYYTNFLGISPKTAIDLVCLLDPNVSTVFSVVSLCNNLINDIKNTECEPQDGYEMKSLTNNPSDVDKGGKLQQRGWYIDNGYEEQYWKTDIKKIASSPDNALIFKTFTYDDKNFPVYNSITYHWNLESESREKAYISYGSTIEIAKWNKDNGFYEGMSVGNSEFCEIIGNDIFKELSILNTKEGYMLKNGLNDVFSFVPQYSGYYKFSTSAYSTIKLFENNELIKVDEDELSYIFEKNKLYKFEVEVKSFTSKSIQYKTSIEPLSIIDPGIYQLTDYIKDNTNQYIIKIKSSTNRIFNFKMYSLVNNTEMPVNYCIYDSNMVNIQKYNLENYNNLAKTYDGTGHIVANIHNSEYYYIVFDLDYDGSYVLEWTFLKDENNFNKITKLKTNKGDYFSCINIPYTSNYEIKFNFYNKNLVKNNTSFLLIKYNKANGFINEFIITCSDKSGNIIKELNLKQGDKLYFGYFNGIDYIDYDFLIFENPKYKFTITTETNSATESTGLGTEVTENNGLRYNNTIEVGFTRVLYLGKDANYPSRYKDYTWSSSDTLIATVSAYGTVHAKREGTVIIRAEDTHGQNNVATIELNIYKNKTEIISIELSTDVNDNPALNGTEVTQNGGLPCDTTIGIGYTRSICIISGGPTNIRQNYIWKSSNDDIASVDMYGIVHANSIGTVVITCTNKYNTNYVGTITITVI